MVTGKTLDQSVANFTAKNFWYLPAFYKDSTVIL